MQLTNHSSFRALRARLRDRQRTHGVRAGLAVAVLAWLGIAVLTLTPAAAGGEAGASPWCLACGPGWVSDAVANILLFVPLGTGLGFAALRPSRALTAVALTTLTIELLQISIVPGRDASLADLLTNLAGGTLGYLASRHLGALVLAPPRRAALLALVWATLWLGGTATTAWALVPELPASLWFAHWQTPVNLAGNDRPGTPTVFEASLAGVPIEPGPVENWPLLRARLLNGSGMALRAFIPASSDPAGTKIAVVDDADTEQELFTFHRVGDAVSFRMSTRAASLGLRAPAIASDTFLSSAPGDTVALTGAIANGWLRLRAVRAGREVSRSLALSPNWGWSFLLPRGLAFGREIRLFTALWVTCLVFPIGYWGARARTVRTSPAAVVGALALAMPALALLFVPPAFGLPPVHWSEWAALALGTGAGVLCARVRRSQITLDQVRSPA